MTAEESTKQKAKSTKPFRVLSVQQPYAELIVRGDKRVENRVWSTQWRGPILIHASNTPRSAAEYREYRVEAGVPRGELVGIVDVVDCVPLVELPLEYDGPHAEGPVCWLLANARRLPVLHPVKGQLGLWKLGEKLGIVIRKELRTLNA